LDQIDLSRLDANTTTPVLAKSGIEAFTFVGSAAFSHRPGEIRHEIVGGNTYVHGDVNGDGVADLTIKLIGELPLSSSEFFL
jgi:hypothetical protein